MVLYHEKRAECEGRGTVVEQRSVTSRERKVQERVEGEMMW